MKKLFISCPMKGRTQENIQKSIERMHREAELVFNQELEVINSYVPENTQEAKNNPVWCLGESIKRMSEADYFIGVYTHHYAGCKIEADVAERYGIRRHMMQLSEVAFGPMLIVQSFYGDNRIIEPETDAT